MNTGYRAIHRYGGDSGTPDAVKSTLDAQDKPFSITSKETDQIGYDVKDRARLLDSITTYHYSQRLGFIKGINRMLRTRYNELERLSASRPQSVPFDGSIPF